MLESMTRLLRFWQWCQERIEDLHWTLIKDSFTCLVAMFLKWTPSSMMMRWKLRRFLKGFRVKLIFQRKDLSILFISSSWLRMFLKIQWDSSGWSFRSFMKPWSSPFLLFALTLSLPAIIEIPNLNHWREKMRSLQLLFKSVPFPVHSSLILNISRSENGVWKSEFPIWNRNLLQQPGQCWRKYSWCRVTQSPLALTIDLLGNFLSIAEGNDNDHRKPTVRLLICPPDLTHFSAEIVWPWFRNVLETWVINEVIRTSLPPQFPGFMNLTTLSTSTLSSFLVCGIHCGGWSSFLPWGKILLTRCCLIHSLLTLIDKLCEVKSDVLQGQLLGQCWE